MPFLTLNNNWSNLAQYYNQSFNNKPEVPTLKYTAFDDGLIRGGALNATLASTRDALRISKFFASGKGVNFVAKQVGLQLSNPQLEQETPKDTFGKLGTNTKSNLLNKAIGTVNIATAAVNDFIKQRSPNQIYNLGLNTLAQIPVTAFGGHIIRQGLLPIGEGYNYEKVVLENNTGKGSPNNRLVKYLKLSSETPYGVLELNRYNGGANSSYGIGETRITTTNVRSTDLSNEIIANNTISSFAASTFNPLTTKQIIEAKQANLYSDLQNQLSGSVLPNNKAIAQYNIEHRIGVSTNKNVDSINVINIVNETTFYGLSVSGSLPSNDSKVHEKKAIDSKLNTDGYFGRDIIKFRIEFLNNDTNLKEVLAFRAYIDDFSDGMNAKWDSYRYMGRGEEFYIYNGFTRDINVAFTMYAHSPEEMKPLYQKLNYLMSSFTPDYNAANKMRGNIGYLTVGDYLYRQPGIFTDIKLSGMLDTHWEIAYNDELPANNDQYEVPKHIKVTLSFKPIHNFLPRRVSAEGSTSFVKAPFITRNDSNNKYLKV